MIITSHMQKIILSIHVYWSYRVNKTQFLKLVIFQPKTKIFPQTLASNISMLEPIQDNDN